MNPGSGPSDNETIIHEIVAKRETSFPGRFSPERLESLKTKLNAAEPPRQFYQALASSERWALIAEIKAKSPSKGKLMQQIDPVRWAKRYDAAGVQAISIVTEENFFNGSLDWIAKVKAVTQLPILRKDFFTAADDILECRAAGADAVLLIAGILDQARLNVLVDKTFHYGMEPVVEVHDEWEVEKALATRARIIGINNRNLKDFSVDIQTTKNLIPKIREAGDRLVISESGIFSSIEVHDLHRAGVKAFLVGEAILTSDNPEATLDDLLN